MSGTSAVAQSRATYVSGGLFTKSAASVQLTQRLSAVAERIFLKPYRALVDLLHISERDAHYRLSATRKYDAVDIANLLQSEDGIQFLVAIMDKARPRWWVAILKMAALGSIEQRRQADLKLMRRVFDADQSSALAFSDSFRTQDPEFFGAVLSGFDEVAGLGGSHRAVVRPPGT